MNDLLEFAIDAHGGLNRWRQVGHIHARLSLGGGLYQLKGLGELKDISMYVDVRRPSVEISPYGAPGRVGHFRPERTWITEGTGALVEEREDPRTTMLGARLTTPWDQIGRLYFSSYALWNYLTTPFLLAGSGFEKQELGPHEEAGEVWRRLRVKYPADIPAHSAVQTFYFNDRGLLVRLDYETDVAGGVAAHYCYDHTTFGGIIFPTLRRVVRRSSENVAFQALPTGVLLQIGDIHIIEL